MTTLSPVGGNGSDARRRTAVARADASMAIRQKHATAYRASEERRRHNHKIRTAAPVSTPPCQTKWISVQPITSIQGFIAVLLASLPAAD